MASSALDKEIAGYLPKLSVAQKKAVLTVVKTFAEEDASFSNTVNDRFAEYESGKTKGMTLDELEAKTRKAYKTKKSK
jgi:hypothetical protein